MIVLRIMLLVGLLCSFVYAPLLVSLVLVFVYSLYFTAYELIILCLFLDAFYGGAGGLPYYLIGAVLVFVFSEWVKPRLLMYNR